MNGERLYTIEDVASYLQVETSFVQRLIARRKIAYVFFNRLYRFKKQDIDAFVEKRRFAFPDYFAEYIKNKYIDNIDYSIRIDIAIDAASQLARRNQQPLSSAHLFYGLITAMGTTAKLVFDQFNVPSDHVANIIKAMTFDSEFSLSTMFECLIRNVQETMAKNEKHDYVNTEHVMKYILDESDVKTLLKNMVVPIDKFWGDMVASASQSGHPL